MVPEEPTFFRELCYNAGNMHHAYDMKKGRTWKPGWNRRDACARAVNVRGAAAWPAVAVRQDLMRIQTSCSFITVFRGFKVIQGCSRLNFFSASRHVARASTPASSGGVPPPVAQPAQGEASPKTDIGEHTRPWVLLDAPRVQPLGARSLSKRSKFFRAFDVFREGAENGARGACAPLSTSVFGSSHALLGLARIFAWIILLAMPAAHAQVVTPPNAPPRVQFAAAKIAEALAAVKAVAPAKIVLVPTNDPAIGREGFSLARANEAACFIGYRDDSGALYGGLELARRIRAAGRLPAEIPWFRDAPVMKLRGPCVALQKTFILPGRHVYEYPYTPEVFPWFYDRQLWIEYLDFLAAQRMNTLYLWNGHPFASLVRLKDYPYAVEVPDEVFQKNQAQFRWLAQECDRRGIWLVQMFYNILVSKPFAETNGIATQLAAPTPLTADYTRKSIAEFAGNIPTSA